MGCDADRDQRKLAQRETSLAPLRCPDCSSDLVSEDGFLACGVCARRYPADRRVIDFRSGSSGASATALTEAFPDVKATTPEAWSDAVREFLRGREDAIEKLDALTAERRQAWKIFLDLKPGGRLLCLGCESGAAIQSLAPHAGQIYVLEQSIAKLRFVQKRLAIFAPDDDITFLAGGGEGRLPFAGDSFDAVIATELTAAGQLTEVRRVLQSEGQFLALADNRLSLSLPAGWWDRWSTVPKPLPQLARTLGLLAGWWRKRSGLQSLPGLRRQLGSVGFSEAEAFGLWPGRSDLEEIIPLRNYRSVDSPKEASPWKARLRRQGLFLPAHCVVAQAGGSRRQSSYERILSSAARTLAGDQETVPLHAERHLLTRKDKMVILLQRGNDPMVLRIPFSLAAVAAEERHAGMAAQLADTRPGLAPRPLTRGRVDGIDFRVETALPGRPLKGALLEQGSAALLERAESLLEALNPEGTLQSAPFEGETYERLVEARLERLFGLLRDQGQQRRLCAFFRTRLYGATMQFGLVHGDFSSSNIYIAGEGAAIIDWESAAFDDLPILDAIGYLESTLRFSSTGHSLAKSFLALDRKDFPSAAEERFLIARYARLGLDPVCHSGLVYLRWLRQIDHLLPYWLGYDPDGQRRYIHEVVESMLE